MRTPLDKGSEGGGKDASQKQRSRGNSRNSLPIASILNSSTRSVPVTILGESGLRLGARKQETAGLKVERASPP